MFFLHVFKTRDKNGIHLRFYCVSNTNKFSLIHSAFRRRRKLEHLEQGVYPLIQTVVWTMGYKCIEFSPDQIVLGLVYTEKLVYSNTKWWV